MERVIKQWQGRRGRGTTVASRVKKERARNETCLKQEGFDTVKNLLWKG